MKEALSYIPDNERFMLIRCDLVLPEEYEVPKPNANIIGIAKNFSCKWKYENNVFLEERSNEHGVAGYFIFKDKSYLADVPLCGEFVRWLQQKEYKFEEQPLYNTHEYSLYSEWEKLPKSKCRPFNKMKIDGNKIYKTAIDNQGKQLAAREIAWYKKLKNSHFENIPRIYSYEPFCMELIKLSTLKTKGEKVENRNVNYIQDKNRQ